MSKLRAAPLFLVHALGAIIAFPIGLIALIIFHTKRFFRYI